MSIPEIASTRGNSFDDGKSSLKILPLNLILKETSDVCELATRDNLFHPGSEAIIKLWVGTCWLAHKLETNNLLSWLSLLEFTIVDKEVDPHLES